MAEILNRTFPRAQVNPRMGYLFFSTFVGSFVLFQFNFFWKKHLIPPGIYRRAKLGLLNFLLIVLLSILLSGILRIIFDLEYSRAFFLVFLFRHLGILIVCLLVVYAYEASERAKLDQRKLDELAHEKTHTELAVLKSQLDPHFLFNTLNSLSGLIRNDSGEAIRFVGMLSDCFRYTLENRNSVLVELNEELEFLKAYLYVMQIRFGSGLSVEVDVQPSDLCKKLPQFAIQLLVENALKHNVISVKKPLKIRVFQNKNEIIVSNVLQKKEKIGGGYGIGLANLKKRYKLLGYDSVRITIEKNSFCVSILLI
ncbi:histidine kinase [Algoriphagus sp. AGSA1]|uniref:sensor histidine kinase n=1 Tax=Algoriphagus sp. AGSA1 TaxID=2907213 RepID=UPI001F19BEA1|nr:histidine kinase [Algoriphagus sp. AGSA1]MCE7053865.1 histidine kinase [Algoriphagus sp. AGSA1]